mgnify:CR=1 FL=1
MSQFTSKQINVLPIDYISQYDISKNQNKLDKIDTLSRRFSENIPIQNLSEAIKYRTISYQDSIYSEPIHFLSFQSLHPFSVETTFFVNSFISMRAKTISHCLN